MTTRKRDFSETVLRRRLRQIGYSGKYLPLSIADVLIHPNRPNESTVLTYSGEKHYQALTRLTAWSNPNQ